MIHNETVNIWTHFLGFFLFSALTVYIVLTDFGDVSKWPILAHYTSTAIMMFFSSYFHLFNCQNKVLYMKLLELDYAGIGICTLGSVTSLYCYGYSNLK